MTPLSNSWYNFNTIKSFLRLIIIDLTHSLLEFVFHSHGTTIASFHCPGTIHNHHTKPIKEYRNNCSPHVNKCF